MGGKFWTSGYYINTVGQYANEEVIKKYPVSQEENQVRGVPGEISKGRNHHDTDFDQNFSIHLVLLLN